MVVKCDNKISQQTSFKEIPTGNCFTLRNDIYLKGLFETSQKPKAVNLVTGEIIDLRSDTIVTPAMAEIHYKI